MSNSIKLDKFKGALPNKRRAITPMRLELQRLIQKNPKKFRALIMPSANGYDETLLRRAGVPPENMDTVENYKPFFDKMREHTEANMTDAPMDLSQRVWLEQGKLFDWMNLDLCGPIGIELASTMNFLAAIAFQDNSFVWATAECSRESERCWSIIDNLCDVGVKIGIPAPSVRLEKRKLALFVLLAVVPKRHGWFPSQFFQSEYRADRKYRGKTVVGNRMLCYGAVYKGMSGVSNKQIVELWKENNNGRYS